LDRTNVRLKMVSRLLKGFQIFLGLVGKNLLYSHAVESRFRDLLIVCNVQASNGPIDEDGLYYLANAQSNSTSSGGSSNHRQNRNAEDAPPRKTRRTDALQQMEDELDKEADREGVVRFGSNSSSGVIKVCVCVNVCVWCLALFVTFGKETLWFMVTERHSRSASCKARGMVRIIVPCMPRVRSNVVFIVTEMCLI
jgi:hypothetical protein